VLVRLCVELGLVLWLGFSGSLPGCQLERSQEASLVLLVKHSVSLEVQWFADTLLFRAPVTILVGCRLVLSIREAARPPDSSTIVLSTVVFGDRPYGGEDSTHCS